MALLLRHAGADPLNIKATKQWGNAMEVHLRTDAPRPLPPARLPVAVGLDLGDQLGPDSPELQHLGNAGMDRHVPTHARRNRVIL